LCPNALGNGHDLTPGAFIAVQTPFNVGIQAIGSFSCRRLDCRLTSNASLRASHVACVLLTRVVRMMRGPRNLLPTGGMREMFERKSLEWDSKGLAVGRELRIGAFSVISAHYRRRPSYE